MFNKIYDYRCKNIFVNYKINQIMIYYKFRIKNKF